MSTECKEFKLLGITVFSIVTEVVLDPEPECDHDEPDPEDDTPTIQTGFTLSPGPVRDDLPLYHFVGLE